MPSFDELIHKLSNAVCFSRLDVKNALHQLELAEESRSITTFITHRGLFRYKRLLFGVNTASEIFQKVFERILTTCKGCINYIDDVVVFGGSVTEHDQNLTYVLQTIEANGVLLNENKCVYKVNKLEFLGHEISMEGIRPSSRKVEAIRTFRQPQTVEETRSFLGLVQYVGKFIPCLADKTEWLRMLIKSGNKFSWREEQENEFRMLNEIMSDITTLGYYY